MIQNFIEELSAEGDFDSPGQFTLDLDKAREKLARHRFPDREAALVALLRAVWLLGGTGPRLDISGLRVRLELPGVELDEPEAEGLASFALEGRSEDPRRRGLQELGLALLSLSGSLCHQVALAGPGWRGRFSGDRTWLWEPGSAPELVIELGFRGSWQAWWKGLLDRWWGRSLEQSLWERTHWYRPGLLFGRPGHWSGPVSLGLPALPKGAVAGVLVQGSDPTRHLPELQTDQAELFRYRSTTRSPSSLSGCLLLPFQQSYFLLVHQGVVLARQFFGSRGLAFQGALHTDLIDLDLSGHKVIQNGRLAQRTSQVRALAAQASAAWLSQLDPHALEPDLLVRLQAVLGGLSRSQADRPLLEALSHLPLIALGGKQRTTLAEVRSSLARHGSLHWVQHAQGCAYLHERPLLDGRAGQLEVLEKLLRCRRVEADDFVHYAMGYRRSDPEPVFARFGLNGPDWRAEIDLGQRARPDEIQLFRKGLPFALSRSPIFPVQDSLFQVRLDGEYDGAFNAVYERLLKELRAQIMTALDGWIEGMLARAAAGDRHLEHYCNLLNLWCRADKPRRARQLPSAWLGHPVTDGAEQVPLGRWLREHPSGGPKSARSLAELVRGDE